MRSVLGLARIWCGRILWVFFEGELGVSADPCLYDGRGFVLAYEGLESSVFRHPSSSDNAQINFSNSL